MTSAVRAKTSKSIVQILKAVFPAASITGAPKNRTMEIIAQMEDSPRRIYTGAIGLIKPGRQAQFNVAIRTVLFHRPTRSAEYGVGGGIVWDSESASEYEECLTKAKVLTSLPKDFDLFETLYWSPERSFVLLEYHLDRMEGSANYFSIPFDRKKLKAALLRSTINLEPVPHRIKLYLTRKGNLRCEACLLSDSDMKFAPLKLAVRPVDSSNLFLFHKTTLRDVYDTVRPDNAKNDDVLLYNEKAQVTESTFANVAFRIGGKLVTPPIHCGLLSGTMRRFLLERGVMQEGVVKLDALERVEAVYLFNSIRGFQKGELLR